MVCHINALQQFILIRVLSISTNYIFQPTSNLHYLIVVAVRLYDIIDNSHYAALSFAAQQVI